MATAPGPQTIEEYIEWAKTVGIDFSSPGGPFERDGAYHQGTVWPWLMGPFLTAYMKVNEGSDAARSQAAEWLNPLRGHLADGGLGHISEIFDGDSPQRPVGCVAQAWSVAEVLRAYIEDVKGIRPAALLEKPEQQVRPHTKGRVEVRDKTPQPLT